MLTTDILERESWRVMEDDSKDEKSGREVGRYLHERFTDEKAGATAGARVVARVFAWDTEKSVVGWCAVVEFSRSGSRSYPGFC